MTAHDPMCPCVTGEHRCETSWAGTHCTRCQCAAIRNARADERDRIATAIEERRCRDCTDYDCHYNDEHVGLDLAADIVRGLAP